MPCPSVSGFRGRRAQLHPLHRLPCLTIRPPCRAAPAHFNTTETSGTSVGHDHRVRRFIHSSKLPVYVLFGWQQLYQTCAARVSRKVEQGVLPLPAGIYAAGTEKYLVDGVSINMYMMVDYCWKRSDQFTVLTFGAPLTGTYSPEWRAEWRKATTALAVCITTYVLHEVSAALHWASLGGIMGPSTRDTAFHPATALQRPYLVDSDKYANCSSGRHEGHVHTCVSLKQIPVWNGCMLPSEVFSFGNVLHQYLSTMLTPALTELSWHTLSADEIEGAEFKVYSPYVRKVRLESLLGEARGELAEMTSGYVAGETVCAPFQVRGIFWPLYSSHTGKWRAEAGDLCFFTVLIQDPAPNTFFLVNVLFSVVSDLLPRAVGLLTTLEDFRAVHPAFQPADPASLPDDFKSRVSDVFDGTAEAFRGTSVPERILSFDSGFPEDIEAYPAQYARRHIARQTAQELLYPDAAVNVAEAVRVFSEKVCVTVGLRGRTLPAWIDLRTSQHLDVALRGCPVHNPTLDVLELVMRNFMLRNKAYDAVNGGLSAYYYLG